MLCSFANHDVLDDNGFSGIVYHAFTDRVAQVSFALV